MIEASESAKQDEEVEEGGDEREKRRESDGWRDLSSEATFHPRISQNGAGEEKWECRFHRFYLAEINSR